MSDNPADPAAFWDAMYDRDDYRYGTRPNSWVAECAERLEPGGRVLCVGDGEGRNGVWLAEQGFDVTTIDPSAVGVAKARRLAVERDVSPTILHGHFPAELPADALGFDAAVLTFMHAPSAVRAAFHHAVVDRLKPGGVVVLDAFTREQLGRSSGGPPNPDMLFTAEILSADFDGLHVERLEEYETVLDEGDGHRGHAALVRMFARKPAGDDR